MVKLAITLVCIASLLSAQAQYHAHRRQEHTPYKYDPALFLSARAFDGGAPGTKVATWRDLSGNGKDAIQANAGHRPTFLVTNEFGLAWGRPVILFFPTTDPTIGATFTNNLIVSNISLAMFHTSFFVGYGGYNGPSALVSSYLFLEHGTNSDSTIPGWSYYGGSRFIGRWDGTLFHQAGGPANWSSNKLLVATFQYDGVAHLMRTNGVVMDNGTVTGAAITNGTMTKDFYLADRNADHTTTHSIGTWDAIWIANSVLTSDQVLEMERHFRRRVAFW